MSTPKKVVDAFSANGAKAGSLELREFGISTMILMEKIKCPLLEKKTDLSNLDVLRLMYILSHPPSECFQALEAGSFDGVVMDFGETISIADVPAIGAKIRELFSRAMSTAPSGQEPEKKTRRSPAIPGQTSRKAIAGTAGS